MHRLGHSRGILKNCTSVVLRNTRVERDPAPPYPLAQALATPGGGPQVNTCKNLTVVNHTSVGTGDDALHEAKVDDHRPALRKVIEHVGGLDVTVNEAVAVTSSERNRRGGW